jgi:beta-glucanase (GH16 family)
MWSDEFDGKTLNPSNWLFDKGAGGWGNNELQFYTNRPENARIEAGVLVIEARKEEYLAWEYTSARIKTHYLHAWMYGRIEARMQLPAGGKGIWPAFWMLGENIATARWPNCGEIDIMENIGNPTMVYGSVHGPGYSGGNAITKPFVSSQPLSDDFHIYAVEWEPDAIRWYVDDQLYHTLRRDQVPGEWVFNHPFFLILNLAIGGNWPGYPDETTVFPQQLRVDYVRVYQQP